MFMFKKKENSFLLCASRYLMAPFWMKSLLLSLSLSLSLYMNIDMEQQQDTLFQLYFFAYLTFVG